jgi:hypothetical protein
MGRRVYNTHMSKEVIDANGNRWEVKQKEDGYWVSYCEAYESSCMSKDYARLLDYMDEIAYKMDRLP